MDSFISPASSDGGRDGPADVTPNKHKPLFRPIGVRPRPSIRPATVESPVRLSLVLSLVSRRQRYAAGRTDWLGVGFIASSANRVEKGWVDPEYADRLTSNSFSGHLEKCKSRPSFFSHSG